MIGAWGRMQLPEDGLRLDEIGYYVIFYGGCAILVSLFTPIPTWFKLRVIGVWLLAIWLITVAEYLTGPTFLNCAAPATILLLPIGVLTLWIARPDRKLRGRTPKGRATR